MITHPVFHRPDRPLVFWGELLVLALSSPFLLFPTVSPLLTLIALLLLVTWWLVRWRITGDSVPVTPFNAALLLWTLALGVGILVTAYPEITLPKATGLILGLAVWRYLALLPPTRHSLRWATLGLAGLGIATIGLGMLGVDWRVKVPALRPLLALLPDSILALPESPIGGINANQLAGLLTFYVPVCAAALLGTVLTPTVSPTPRRRRHLRILTALLPLSIVSTLLLLTQSRSGWIGGSAGLLALLVLWTRFSNRQWVRQIGWGLIAIALLVSAGAALAIDAEQLAALWESPGGVATEVGTLTLAGRVEIWSRALYAIQDFPFTGCGLGTFREVIWVLYPLFSISPDRDLAHAHNIFLQTALDVGIPGLIAYLALLGLAGVTAWQTARRAPRLRPLALGLLAGLLALHTYGLTDALAPGSKPAIIVWYALGMLALLSRRPEP